jgi:hypothetical protein
MCNGCGNWVSEQGYDKSSMWSASYKPDESRKILTARDLKKSASIGMQMNVPATTTTMRKRPLPSNSSHSSKFKMFLKILRTYI